MYPTLAHLANCNFTSRYQQWQAAGGTLLGNLNLGCGLNSLTFLGVLSRPKGEALVSIVNQKGTSFLEMMNYVYTFHQGSVNLSERSIPITTEAEVQQFLNILLQDLPDNSCTVAKLMRYPDNTPPHLVPQCKGLVLTSGHSIVFSKNRNPVTGLDEISAIDPQQMKLRNNIKANTSFPAWNNQCYVSVSLIYGNSLNMQLPRKVSRKARKTSRKVRKTSRKARKTSRKVSRKARKTSRKVHKTSRKTSRKARKTSRKVSRKVRKTSRKVSRKVSRKARK